MRTVNRCRDASASSVLMHAVLVYGIPVSRPCRGIRGRHVLTVDTVSGLGLCCVLIACEMPCRHSLALCLGLSVTECCVLCYMLCYLLCCVLVCAGSAPQACRPLQMLQQPSRLASTQWAWQQVGLRNSAYNTWRHLPHMALCLHLQAQCCA